MGRVDIDKAITAHGGYPAVAGKLEWGLSYKKRKPRGYDSWVARQSVRESHAIGMNDIAT